LGSKPGDCNSVGAIRQQITTLNRGWKQAGVQGLQKKRI
jgi:hypothetical protein